MEEKTLTVKGVGNGYIIESDDQDSRIAKDQKEAVIESAYMVAQMLEFNMTQDHIDIETGVKDLENEKEAAPVTKKLSLRLGGANVGKVLKSYDIAKTFVYAAKLEGRDFKVKDVKKSMEEVFQKKLAELPAPKLKVLHNLLKDFADFPIWLQTVHHEAHKAYRNKED